MSDADEGGVDRRFTQLLEGLHEINETAVGAGVEGFPVPIPERAGEVAERNTRLGIYIFPDNAQPGTLETVLLECAETSYAAYHQPVHDLVDSIDRSRPPDAEELRVLRTFSGRKKASAGIIGNILFPGASLTTAIERGSWFDPLSGAEVGVLNARRFLTRLLR